MSLTSYLGIDVGSVTTKVAIVDENGKYVDSYMLRTAGKPVLAVQEGLKHLKSNAKQEYNIQGVGTTGSGRNLAGALVGALLMQTELGKNMDKDLEDGFDKLKDIFNSFKD